MALTLRSPADERARFSLAAYLSEVFSFRSNTKFSATAKATADFNQLNQWTVLNIGMNLSASIRGLMMGSGDSTIDVSLDKAEQFADHQRSVTANNFEHLTGVENGEGAVRNGSTTRALFSSFDVRYA